MRFETVRRFDGQFQTGRRVALLFASLCFLLAPGTAASAGTKIMVPGATNTSLSAINASGDSAGNSDAPADGFNGVNASWIIAQAY